MKDLFKDLLAKGFKGNVEKIPSLKKFATRNLSKGKKRNLMTSEKSIICHQLNVRRKGLELDKGNLRAYSFIVEIT